MKKIKGRQPIDAPAAGMAETPTVMSQAPEGSPSPAPAEPATTSCSFDPEREEIAYDERGEPYHRLTPQGMLEEANDEVNQRELAEYSESISVLRHKGLSYREIAEFLTKRGVYADHNAVYRVYTRNMSPEDLRNEEEREAMEALDARDAS